MIIKWYDKHNYIMLYIGKVWVIKNGMLWSIDGSTNCQHDTYDINKEFEEKALVSPTY